MSHMLKSFYYPKGQDISTPQSEKIYIGESAGKAIAAALIEAKISIRIFSYNISLNSKISNEPFNETTIGDLLKQKIEENVKVSLAVDYNVITHENGKALASLFIQQESHEITENVLRKKEQEKEYTELKQKSVLYEKMLWLLLLIVPILAVCFMLLVKVDVAFIFAETIFIPEIHFPKLFDILRHLIILIVIVGSSAAACIFARRTVMHYFNQKLLKMQKDTNSIPIKKFSYNKLGELALVDYKSDKDFSRFHTKMYIIDNTVAFVGSPNFTHTAFYDNYECRVKITDAKEVEALTEYYDATIDQIKERYLCIGMDALAACSFEENVYI